MSNAIFNTSGLPAGRHQNGNLNTQPAIADITCPKCGERIPLSEAVTHASRERIAAELTAQFATQKKVLVSEANLKARESVSLEMSDLRNQVAEKQGKLKEAQAAELELRRKQRELETARENLQLEVERTLAAERQQITEAARQQAAEAERLNLNQKELHIKQLTDQIAVLKQKAEQGSMQLQGESLEVTLHADLRASFVFDEITEVKTGERGADVLHKVRTNIGMDCGTILWEAKRARNWSDGWVEKLKENQRNAKAEFAVLVATCLPSGVRGIGQFDGIWVCEPAYACPLANALRHGLVSLANRRVQDTGKTEKAARIYDYVCGLEFRHHIEGMVEAFTALEDQVRSERRAFDKQWKEREAQLKGALGHMFGLFGSVQGIAGREALPEIQSLGLRPGDVPPPTKPVPRLAAGA